MQSWFVGWGSHALRKDKKFAHHILYQFLYTSVENQRNSPNKVNSADVDL
jgi:hypothetical protein